MASGEILAAAWIAPISSPLMRDAAVAFSDGRITALGPIKEIRSQHPDFVFRDLGSVIILPGLINAHTHLELSTCCCGDQAPERFSDWILSLPQRHTMDAETLARLNIESVRAGIEQSLRYGVTCVGDISQFSQFSRSVLADSPLRAVSYAEALGLGSRRMRFEMRLEEIHTGALDEDRITLGISPHAPYTVDLPGYRQCLEKSREERMSLATHLSEWPDEAEFLRGRTGMFRELYDRLGFNLDGVETFPDTPIQFAHAIGLLQHPSLLAHVNYCNDDELALLAAGRSSVVYCPRTHRYFGHGPHRWREMLAAGINVAIGTDSCASSPDLNLVDDLRLLHEIAPEVSPETIWQLATINGARALQRSDIGSLSFGNYADLVAFPVASDRPLGELLENSAMPTQLWIAGQPIH